MLEQSSVRIEVARAYDPVTPGRYRVLVDRLWPRGLTKEALAVDEWMRDVAPSTALRKWYGHDPARFDAFARRYRDELGVEPASAAVGHLVTLARSRGLVLVTATRDVEHSGARVLRDHLTAVTELQEETS
jgi:uncharacterized protein YeaO (DUF488 family)